MELPSSSTKHGTYATLLYPSNPSLLRFYLGALNGNATAADKHWASIVHLHYFLIIQRIYAVYLTFFGGARIARYLLATLVSISYFPVLDPILFPLYYCKLVMTGSNSELIRARIFWCRYLCCRCCCKRFNIDSVADEVFMEYSTGFCPCVLSHSTEFCPCFLSLFLSTQFAYGKLTSAAAIHARICSGLPIGYLQLR